jgi:hypothetical protein
LRDIFRDVSFPGIVKFTAETKVARAWMGQRFHEIEQRYAVGNTVERAEAERFQKDATAAGLEVYGLDSN